MTDEMHGLLGKYFSGQATAEERLLVQQWAADEKNRADFDLLVKLWHKSGEHAPIPFDTEKAWQAVNAKIKTSTTPVRRIRPLMKVVAVAASLVLVFGLWWLLGGLPGRRTVVADVAVKEVKLEDGSTVYLRKGSRLQYNRSFGKERRTVSLNGEAFFEVMPDPAKPFVVSAGGTRVEVVGTSFSVVAHKDSVELIVKTGKVKFGAAGNIDQSVLVTAGERALFAGDSINKELNEDENFNAWQSGQLIFNNTSLPEVLAALNEFYNVNIRMKQDDAVQLSAARLTVHFNNQPLDAVLDEISLITSYRIQRLGDAQYEISIK